NYHFPGNHGDSRALYLRCKGAGGERMTARTTLGTSIPAILLLVGHDVQDSKSLLQIPDRVQFNRDIRPILSENCVKCHGPGARKATLRLDLRDSAYAPAESGKTALVPGDLAKSELWQRIST